MTGKTEKIEQIVLRTKSLSDYCGSNSVHTYIQVEGRNFVYFFRQGKDFPLTAVIEGEVVSEPYHFADVIDIGQMEPNVDDFLSKLRKANFSKFGVMAVDVKRIIDSSLRRKIQEAFRQHKPQGNLRMAYS